MDRKGISPVIATVIIVAVAIAISIAVAFWMTGIVGLFTGFEQVQITYVYAKNVGTNQWLVELQAKNTGTSTASIDDIFINGKPINDYNANSVTLTDADGGSVTSFPHPLTSGSSVKIVIYINGGFSSGQSIEVKLHTASGKEYPKLVVLP